MGLRDKLRGKRVYFDANIFIYLMEGFASLAHDLNEIRDSIAHGESSICTSELTLCEVLVPAFRANNTSLLALYRQFNFGDQAGSLAKPGVVTGCSLYPVTSTE